MSDRRAVSAGQLASSVAANEPWRVAVGGNRVQNMTVEQIAQAFAAGQLTVRTPLWPPGTSGWQALGNFEQFTQSGTFAQPGYGLSQFEESDDDPTRMWTGSADLSELPGMGMAPTAMDPVPPMPSVPPPLEPRPSARTGPRQVSTRAPAVRSVPAPPVARPPSMPPAAIARAMRPRRSSGLWLVAGLVGLVALGSAVLAARGTSSIAAPTETVASATPSPEPSRAVAPSDTEAPKAEAPKAEEPKQADPAAPAQPEATAKADGEVNQARLAKYEDSAASAFVAEGKSAKETKADEAKPASDSEKADDSDAVAARPARAKASRVSSVSKRVAAASKAKPAAHAALEPKETKEAKEPAKEVAKPAKEAKADAQGPASSAVNEAAATALGNSAKLASSCRPRGGPAGEGKARVIYSNDGEVQSVEILTAKFRDTLTGSCVKMVFRRAKIAPFKGEPPTFIKSFTIPEE
jgi:hypothetical protein